MPFEMAIFVVDEGHRHLAAAQHGQRVHRVDLVGDDRRRAHQRAQVERLAVDQAATTSRAWTTPISWSTEPSATGMRLCGRLDQRLRRIVVRVGVDVDPVDLGARRHHLARRPVGEPHDARDDRPLIFLEHAGAVRLGDDEVQLLGGDLVVAVAVEAEQPEDEAAGAVEQPDERRRRLGDPAASAARRSTAIGSGERSAICLGTSSPITSEA